MQSTLQIRELWEWHLGEMDIRLKGLKRENGLQIGMAPTIYNGRRN